MLWRESGEIIIPVAHGSRAAVSGWKYLLPRKRGQGRRGDLRWGRNEKFDLVKFYCCLNVLQLDLQEGVEGVGLYKVFLKVSPLINLCNLCRALSN